MGFIKFRYEDDENEEPLFGKEMLTPAEEKIVIDKALMKKPEKEDSFVIHWEKRLGFSRNPFEAGILSPIDDYVVGYKKEREMLNLFVIENRSFGTISGQKGFGKSYLLAWLSSQLRKFSRRIIVIDIPGDRLKEGQGLTKVLLSPFLGIIEKHFRKSYLRLTIEEAAELLKNRLGRRKLVMLIDDFIQISKQNLMLLNSLMALPNACLIMAGEQDRIKRFIKSVGGLDAESAGNIRDELRIELSGFSFADAKEMLTKRVEKSGGLGIEPFNDDFLKDLYKRSDKSPSAILDICAEEAVKLSVNPEAVQRLKDDGGNPGNKSHYRTSSYEHKVRKSDMYDSIEVIKHEPKAPIIIRDDDDQVSYEYENE